MIANSIITERIKSYSPQSLEEENDAIKEILQEVILFGLSDSDFFEKAAFHGGSSLRILYGLPRFSEDLDFLLDKADRDFDWNKYSAVITNTCNQFGIAPEYIDKSKADSNVKKMFLKDNSLGKILNLTFARPPRQKFRIKLEIDVNPPDGSISETKFLNFPVSYSVKAQDKSSGFAGKCHALLCRNYVKGRDWYDFIWYVNQKVKPNLQLLDSAIVQNGPWKNQNVHVQKNWLIENLEAKIRSIDWEKASQDVAPFLRRMEKRSLKVWGASFFMDVMSKLQTLL